MLLKEGGENHHRETQLQLQRKIHEKKYIKEQKRKISEQQSAIYKNSLHRSQNKKNTGPKTKEFDKFRNQLKVYQSDDKVPKKTIQRSHSADDTVIAVDNRTLDDANNNKKFGSKVRRCASGDVAAANSSNPSTAQGKLGTDKCLASIIFMPSLHIASLPNSKPKYKRIQPKPHADDKSAVETTDDVASNNTFDGVDSASSNSEIQNRLKRSVAPEALEADGNKKAHIQACTTNGGNISNGVSVINCGPALNGSNKMESKMGSNDACEASNLQVNKTEQLSQLRWLLQQNLNKSSSKNIRGNAATAVLDSDSADVNISLNSASFCPPTKPVDENEGHVSTQMHENPAALDKCFQFTPISLRSATPADSLCSTTHSSLTNSPIPSNYSSQQATPNIFGPASNDSPFVSPLATPLSRSRHNSGQANPRMTSSQTVTESSNSSPFLSPHGTPVHVRSRHGSGAQTSVRFNSLIINNRHTHTLHAVREIANPSEKLYSRSRNVSGNSVTSLPPLSPLSKSAPMSPLYSQFSSSQPDLTQENCNRIGTPFFNPSMQQQLPRQSSAIQHQAGSDPSQEVRFVLQNPTSGSENSRCQSVPLYQMLNYMTNQAVPPADPGQDSLSFSKSYPATPNESQVFQFPSEAEQQMDPYFQDTAANYDVSYPATPATTPVQLQSYPSTPVGTMSYPSSIINVIPDRFAQSNQMIYESANTSDLAPYPEQSQADLTLTEDLQAALDNLKNCSDLSQLEKELENNL